MAQRITEQDREEFAAYCRSVTDAQVRGVYEKEKAANRKVYAAIAKAEADRRGIDL
jgi:hypothetical protein